MEFVGKGNVVAPDGGFLSGNVGRVTPLHHEPADVAMKDRSVVSARRRQSEKVKGGARAGVAKDLAFQIPVRRVDCDRHGSGCFNRILP